MYFMNFRYTPCYLPVKTNQAKTGNVQKQGHAQWIKNTGAHKSKYNV